MKDYMQEKAVLVGLKLDGDIDFDYHLQEVQNLPGQLVPMLE